MYLSVIVGYKYFICQIYFFISFFTGRSKIAILLEREAEGARERKRAEGK